MRAAEPVVAEPAQRVVAAEVWHQVEGHGLSVCHVRSSRARRGRHSTRRSARKLIALPEIHVEAVERVSVERPVVEVVEFDAVPAAVARVARTPVVDLDVGRRPQEVRLRRKPRRRRVVEDLLDRGQRAILSGPDPVMHVLEPDADEDVAPDGLVRGTPAEFLAAEREVALIAAHGRRAEAVVVLGGIVAVLGVALQEEATVGQFRERRCRPSCRSTS